MRRKVKSTIDDLDISHTTKIASFSTTNDNLVIKSIIKYIYVFFGILLNFNFSTDIFI